MKTTKSFFILLIVSLLIIAGCSKKSPTNPTSSITSVVVSPAQANVPKGTYFQLSATVNGNNNPSQAVNWSLSTHVNGTSVSTSGLLTVSADETAQSLTVTATSVADPNKSGFATITVTNDPNVVVNPPTAEVVRGTYKQFTATVNGLSNPSLAVTWSVNSTTTGTIITSGILMVSANETAETLIVTATSQVDTNLSGFATVTVINPPPTVSTVVITPATANLNSGETFQFSAVVNGANSPSQEVTWSVSGQVSNSTTINASGLLGVGSNETATLTVRATSVTDPSKSGTATVNVMSAGGTWTVTDTSTWNTAVNGIRNGGNNKYHTINVNSNITILPSVDFIFGSVTGITVLIQGNSTISSSSNNSLLCIGNQQTVVIKDLTLQGSSSSTVVKVGFYDIIGGITNESSASFRMEGNSKISGGGCGVDVGRGTTFIMKDNSMVTGISDYFDAGVEVYYATFIMQDYASVTNNSHSGVSINSGTFTMRDNSSVSNNTNTTSGGGVSISGGVFTMKDNSKVMNNTATGTGSSSYATDVKGGGVYVSSGTFILENGSITGNTVQHTGNRWAYGGGVCVDSGNAVSATFTMYNGTISGNTARATYTPYGGGVYMGWTQASDTFTKTGGTIYGSDASESLRNIATNGNGHAVAKASIIGSVEFWRNQTAGPGDNSTDYGFWLND